MENASKALIIAGAILLCILIIAIGMYIYTQAEGNIRSSVESMSTQEVDAFNSEWTVYDGETNGSAVKALLGRLVANYSTYSSESAKVPNVEPANITNHTTNITCGDNYVSDIGNLRADIENKHTYKVKCEYDKETGLIHNIKIDFNID